MESVPENSLVLVWSSKDPEVAENMVFMYGRNARLKGWWESVTLVVWGPSAGLLAENAELQSGLKALQAAGVRIMACRACADRYGVSDALTALGCEVVYMGEPLTRFLKSGQPVLTF